MAAELATRPYVKYSLSLEQIPEGEDDDIEAVARQINEIQKDYYRTHRRCFTGTHPRTQGIVKGKFIVPDDLPAYLKQGELFDHGGEYDVVARYSTETQNPSADDREPAPRGFSMKLFGVSGDFYPGPGTECHTQDIEFNSTPMLELSDAKTTREIFDMRMKHGMSGSEMEASLLKRPDRTLQLGRYQVHNTHLESLGFYSQTAYRYGDYVIKYKLTPNTELQKQLAQETATSASNSNILHAVTNPLTTLKNTITGGPGDQQQLPKDVLSEWLKDYYSKHDAEYLFQVQLLENLDDQPIEYAGTEWDEQKYPFQTVARVVFPKQDSFSFKAKAFWEDSMRLDPWGVYPASANLRRKMNGSQEVHVKSIDEIPF
ncbi:putative catalase protein [Diplogelasinospora grovesii]|uniref:Catalase protein n=1 Tax=Diplogelasinospora grovesii TaxID=303347 RepID=A0AAN6N577_9PEZI|nr:putative catalase protein [Diplogelasinospora grovesii]